MYKDTFPDIISTIVKLKNSNKIDPRSREAVEKLNE